MLHGYSPVVHSFLTCQPNITVCFLIYLQVFVLLYLDDTTFSRFLFSLLLHWIEKRSSRGRLLEHLEYSGTKSMMRGPIVRQLCME